MTVDWARWRKCQVCGAPLGEPCMTASGYVQEPGMVVRDRPHSRRELRAAAARDAQFGRTLGTGR